MGARRRKKPTGYQEKRFLHYIILHNFCKSGVPACESEGNDKSLSGGVIPIGAAKRRRPRDSSSLILAHPSGSDPSGPRWGGDISSVIPWLVIKLEPVCSSRSTSVPPVRERVCSLRSDCMIRKRSDGLGPNSLWPCLTRTNSRDTDVKWSRNPGDSGLGPFPVSRLPLSQLEKQMMKEIKS